MVDFTIAGSSTPYHTVINRHVFESLAFNARIALHVRTLYGRDPHHITEAQYKAVARALRQAVEPDPGSPVCRPPKAPCESDFGEVGRCPRLRVRQPALGAALAGTGRRARRGDRRRDRGRQRRRSGGARGGRLRVVHDRPAFDRRREDHRGAGGRRRPVLGVCVGMQILFARGVEFGVESTGCGQWPGAVTRLDAPVIPHMGWNVVQAAPGSTLFRGLDADTRFYFVHSYAAQRWEGSPEALLTWATHEVPFWPLSRTARWPPHNFIRRRAATPARSCSRIGLRDCDF